MGFKIVITKVASTEIKDSIDFYESRQKGLGKEFLNYLKGYLKILETNPDLFAIKKSPSYRELTLKTFPFIIVYEIIDNEVIVYSGFTPAETQKRSPDFISKLLLIFVIAIGF